MRQHTIGMVLAVLLGLLLAASVPQAQATTITQTRYLRPDYFYTIEGWYHYGWANLTDSYGNQTLEDHRTVYNGAIQFAVDIFHMTVDTDYLEVETQLATKVLAMERSGDTEGWQSAQWTCSNQSLTRLDSLKIAMYVRYRASATVWGSWYPLDVNDDLENKFQTEHLGMDSLIASEWNATFYTKRLRVGAVTYAYVYFGNSTYDSRIENMQFDDGSLVEENNMLPVGFLLGTMIAIPIGILIAKKR